MKRIGCYRGLSDRPSSEAEVPLGVVVPGVALQERILIRRFRLNVAPVAVENVLACVDQLARVRDCALIDRIRGHEISMRRPRERCSVARGRLAAARSGYELSVQGILPTIFAAINVRSTGSQTSTVSARASAMRAEVEPGLGLSTCFSPSSVTTMIWNDPSSPSPPATQLAFMIVTRRACSLAPGMAPI